MKKGCEVIYRNDLYIYIGPRILKTTSTHAISLFGNPPTVYDLERVSNGEEKSIGPKLFAKLQPNNANSRDGLKPVSKPQD